MAAGNCPQVVGRCGCGCGDSLAPPLRPCLSASVPACGRLHGALAPSFSPPPATTGLPGTGGANVPGVSVAAPLRSCSAGILQAPERLPWAEEGCAGWVSSPSNQHHAPAPWPDDYNPQNA